MKKSILVFFILTFFFFSENRSLALTTVPAGNVSGTWTLAGSPYNVTGNIIVPTDSTLTIAPGVTISFQGHYYFYVMGKILAIGTAADTIVFTAASTSTGWFGLRFDQTPVAQDSSIFQYCKLQWGKANGGSDLYGGAFYLNQFFKVRIANCRIANCTASQGGGAICCTANTPTSGPIITNSSIKSNTALFGGGIYCVNVGARITNNTISNNTITNAGSGAGGGGVVLGTNSTLTGNTITNNSATNSAGRGGGVYTLTTGCIITNNTISNNTAGDYGGGLFYGNSGTSVLSGNIISYNTASSLGGTGFGGGGIHFYYQTSGDITNNTISNNSSPVGGGLFFESVAGGTPVIKNNTITNNTATGTSGFGGGIYYRYCSSTITNCTIANNTAAGASGGGGAIYCMGNPVFINTILWGNTATSTNGNSVYCSANSYDPIFSYCDLQGGSAGIYSNGVYTGSYTNNINIDPPFVSPSGGVGTGFNGVTANWSLQNTSTCIDAGDPTMITQSTDKAGNPRITICRIDMGAYEYQTGIPFAVSLAQTAPVLCNGYSTGALAATASGDVAPYTYSWNPGGATTSAISNLSAGNYTVTAYNSGGCARTQTITITQPAGMNLTTSQTNINCNGNCIGSASVTVTGGTAPYTFAWSTGETSSATAANLCSGPYTVTVTATGGCAQTKTVTISAPGALSFTHTQVNVSCHGGNNGSITVSASGGTGTKNYSKDGGTNYQLSNIFSGLTAATYSLVVKDGAGCQTSIIPVTVTEPGVLTTSITPTTINCYGATNGTAAAAVTGGTSPFTYSWNSAPVQTTATATGLPLGNYTVSVTDSKGCTSSATTSIVSTLPAVPICLVTVDTSTSTKNVIVWEKPVTTALDSFRIYREIGLNNFVRIGSVPYAALSQYTDTTNGVNPKIQSYRYKVSCVDSCGSESTLSAYHRTIHLSTPNFSPPKTFDLIWTNDYEGFSFSQYYILRDGNNTGTWTKIDSVTFGNLSYTDINAPTDSARYIIEAAPASPCTVSIKNVTPEASTIKSSKSNTSDRTQNPVSVPENTLDNSISLFPNPNQGSFTLQIADYKLQIAKLRIYNMMGELVYQTSVSNPKTEIKIPETKGVYQLQVIAGGFTTNKKIIIQ